MLTVATLLIVFGFVILVARGPARPAAQRTLIASERLYALGATLPLILAFGMPGALRFAFSQGPTVRLWSNRLTALALWLSLGLTLAGILLLRRVSRRHGPPPGSLKAALGLAAIPGVFAILLIALRLLGNLRG